MATLETQYKMFIAFNPKHSHWTYETWLKWHSDQIAEGIKELKKMKQIYLDDIRTPRPETGDWVVVRNYDEFVSKVTEIGLDNIRLISLDHDLGDSAMKEWHNNVYHNYTLDYNNITEKTGMDCTKWLVEQWLNGARVCNVMVHSANAVGSANMMGYINNYKHIHRMDQDCGRWVVPHTMETIIE